MKKAFRIRRYYPLSSLSTIEVTFGVCVFFVLTVGFCANGDWKIKCSSIVWLKVTIDIDSSSSIEHSYVMCLV